MLNFIKLLATLFLFLLLHTHAESLEFLNFLMLTSQRPMPSAAITQQQNHQSIPTNKLVGLGLKSLLNRDSSTPISITLGSKNYKISKENINGSVCQDVLYVYALDTETFQEKTILFSSGEENCSKLGSRFGLIIDTDNDMPYLIASPLLYRSTQKPLPIASTQQAETFVATQEVTAIHNRNLHADKYEELLLTIKKLARMQAERIDRHLEQTIDILTYHLRSEFGRDALEKAPELKEFNDDTILDIGNFDANGVYRHCFITHASKKNIPLLPESQRRLCPLTRIAMGKARTVENIDTYLFVDNGPQRMKPDLNTIPVEDAFTFGSFTVDMQTATALAQRFIHRDLTDDEKKSVSAEGGFDLTMLVELLKKLTK